MKLIKTITEQDIAPEAPLKSNANFNTREAARAVVYDNDGCIALLRVGKYNYHKLPGGGVENGEDITQALQRELIEEIGCQAKIDNEIGQIIEYRDQFELKQTSYCYVAEQSGEIINPSFTDKEIEEEFSIVWVTTIDKAIEIIENDTPTNYEGKFIKLRDLTILIEAQRILTHETV